MNQEDMEKIVSEGLIEGVLLGILFVFLLSVGGIIYWGLYNPIDF